VFSAGKRRSGTTSGRSGTTGSDISRHAAGKRRGFPSDPPAQQATGCPPGHWE
jgi:hypothetical protein